MITTEFQNLTQRQKEVCIAFANSKGIKPIEYISNKLGIAKTTVKTHINDIFTKLLVDSQVQLMYYLLIKR